MNERFCTVGDVEICFETFGDDSNPTMLLVMGLATQMLGWHHELCEELAGRGFHVVRFDNRDVGRSTHFSEHRPPTVRQLLRRDKRAAAYTLSDMANDAVGLLDHLEVEAAHVVGASMGGMIGQVMAAEHHPRVLSLASIMSTTGSRRVGQAKLKAYPVLLKRPPSDRDGYVERAVRTFGVIGSPEFEQDWEHLRWTAGQSHDRGFDPAGSGRQLAAIIASGNRTESLKRITAPTVVIHGTHDILVPISGGKATAKAIPGAKLVPIKGMGHDLPRAAWPQIIAAIVENTARAGERAPAGA